MISTILVTLIFWVTLQSCQDNVDYKEVNFSLKAPFVKASVKQPHRVLIVAFSPIIDAEDGYTKFLPLINHLEASLNISVQSIFNEKYRDTYRLFKEKKVDIAFICTGLYVLGQRNNLFDLWVVPRINNKVTYQSYIITSGSIKAESFEDLRGLSFAFTDELSLTGYFYPTYRTQGQNKFWRSEIFSGNHTRSVQMVQQGIVDAASVDGIVFDDLITNSPQKYNNVRIVEKSSPFGIPPLVISRHVNAKERKQMEQFFLNLDKTPKGLQLLNGLKIEKFEKPQSKNYISVGKFVPKTILR